MFGGEFFDAKGGKFVANSAAAIEALQWNRDLMHALRLVPAPTQNASAQGITFNTQRVAIQGAWPRQPVRYSDELGTKVFTIPLPAGKKGSIAVTKSNNFMVWSSSKQTDLAFEVIRAMTSARGEIEEMKAYGFIYPARRDSLESKEFRDLAQWDLNVHKYAQDRAHRLPLMRELPWNTMTKIWDDELKKLWNDQVSAKQAAEQMTTALNNELAAGRGGR
jgi:ABC-type glycerol-3-phosphate transport system substrate-binding protein